MVRNVKLPVIQPAPTERPRTVADCRDGPRPCPWIGCRFNLLADVLEDGSLVLNARYPGGRLGAERPIPPREDLDGRFRDEIDDFIDALFDEPDPSIPSCVIDAPPGGAREDAELEAIAQRLYVSRERVRQIEASGLENLRTNMRRFGLKADALDLLTQILHRSD